MSLSSTTSSSSNKTHQTIGENTIPITINHKRVRDYLKNVSLATWCIYSIALIFSVFYIILYPMILVLWNIYLYYKKTPQNNYCKTRHPSAGVISTHTCPKTQRTYSTRFLNQNRDTIDASCLLSSGFSIDPFHQYLFQDINVRHLYGPAWYQITLASYSSDVIVQEWIENEKLVGTIICSQRNSNFFYTMIDQMFLTLFLIRLFFIYPTTVHTILKVVFALNEKYHAVLDPYGQFGSATKFLAVEKGFQHQGIGSNLMRTTVKHFDALGLYSYIESSNIANVALYERYGYRLFEQYHCTPECPPLYLMLRDPKPQQIHNPEHLLSEDNIGSSSLNNLSLESDIHKRHTKLQE